jgi:hypothetical protein
MRAMVLREFNRPLELSEIPQPSIGADELTNQAIFVWTLKTQPFVLLVEA